MRLQAFPEPDRRLLRREPHGPPPRRPIPAPPHAFMLAYGWACCVFGQHHFVYVYGLSADCARLGHIHRGTTLRKGETASLSTAQENAKAAAARLDEIYQDLGGSAQAMPVRDFLYQRYGLNLGAT